MTIFLDVKFAFTQRVPEFYCPVARTRNDLPIISAKADGKNVGRMANETARCNSSIEIPQAESMVPGRGQSKLTVRGDDDIGNEVIVSMKYTLGITVRVVFASQLPDNDGLVCDGEIRWNLEIGLANSPREAVKIISGFSEDVAIAVTHPLWPSREPR